MIGEGVHPRCWTVSRPRSAEVDDWWAEFGIGARDLPVIRDTFGP